MGRIQARSIEFAIQPYLISAHLICLTGVPTITRGLYILSNDKSISRPENSIIPGLSVALDF